MTSIRLRQIAQRLENVCREGRWLRSHHRQGMEGQDCACTDCHNAAEELRTLSLELERPVVRQIEERTRHFESESDVDPRTVITVLNVA